MALDKNAATFPAVAGRTPEVDEDTIWDARRGATKLQQRHPLPLEDVATIWRMLGLAPEPRRKRIATVLPVEDQPWHRSVPCPEPDCHAPVGRACITTSGAYYGHSHVTRRREAGDV